MSVLQHVNCKVIVGPKNVVSGGWRWQNGEHIPVQMQGRVYAARNTFQFFTIPLGYILGGFLVDKVFEPFMEKHNTAALSVLFGTGKGSGAAFLFLFLAFAGIGVCLIFRKDKYIWKLE